MPKKKIILIVLASIIFISISIFVYNKTVTKVEPATISMEAKQKTFKTSDLAKYNGDDDSLPIYIGLNGQVYDVSKGRDFYKKDGPYHYIAGKDSSVELNLFGADLITKKYQSIGILAN